MYNLIRGREVVVVVKFTEESFKSTFTQSHEVEAKQGIEAEGVAEATKSLKLKMSKTSSDSIKSVNIESMAFARGRQIGQIAPTTLDGALEAFSSLLTDTDNSSVPEGIIQINLRPYSSVYVAAGGKRTEFGRVFNSKVVEAANQKDPFSKVVDLQIEANDSIKKLSKIPWSQWSLDVKISNGVATQYLNWEDYLKKIDSVVDQCKDQFSNPLTASSACLKLAEEVLRVRKPIINLPVPVAGLQVYYPPEVTNPLTINATSYFLNADLALKKCREMPAKLGYGAWTMPSKANWERLTMASRNYIDWKKVRSRQNGLEYDPNAVAETKNDLANLCGRLTWKTFWSFDPGTSRNPSLIWMEGSKCKPTFVSPRDENKSGLFTTTIISRAACVSVENAKGNPR